jgi:hypothetical protein
LDNKFSLQIGTKNLILKLTQQILSSNWAIE